MKQQNILHPAEIILLASTIKPAGFKNSSTIFSAAYQPLDIVSVDIAKSTLELESGWLFMMMGNNYPTASSLPPNQDRVSTEAAPYPAIPVHLDDVQTNHRFINPVNNKK